MEQIYPLQEEVIANFCGLPVCVIMQDGTRHVGVLSHCRNGRLTLNGQQEEVEAAAELNKAKPSKLKKGKGKNSKAAAPKVETVQAQAYPYDPYAYNPFFPIGGAIALDLALVAFLFLLL
ncbi:hypothetical protein [Paenibacillus radicis (ex Gao et al. 2016)]|uniref:Uncharacterized protein n=1 Tax=Paenibacillus radicis (ex Gao et al. 2016) TaxID=1737354 RepID=A0A917HDD5_9BACL|nr:hypothetical protein [Paenibacillus radicis (ex Gao et al. 2016)]GGG76149.1 hypothetical protein GCM10010918_35760 [Paenibacillus radicis (ex Gao et al. 2016)]